MCFKSILFYHKPTPNTLSPTSTMLSDLNLDQIIKTVISYKKDFDIEKFFYIPLDDATSITYRQEVINDLQNDDFFLKVDDFCQKMLKTKRQQKFIEQFDVEIYKKSWFFQMVVDYTKAILEFLKVLNDANLTSKGFKLLNEYILSFTNSTLYKSMQNDMHSLQKELNSIIYDITIDGLTIKVKRYEDEKDCSQKVKELFEKFAQDDAKDEVECHYEKNRGTNHINAKILQFVGKLYPETFKKLDNFCATFENIVDETILTFTEEVEFYIAYLLYINDIKKPHLCFSNAKVQTQTKEVEIKDGFDLALAYKLSSKNRQIVTNDYTFKNGKRIMIVSGANQGGKSTYARAFGQIAYITKLGLLVPAKDATIFLYDNVFTHFEKEEHVYSLQSKLQEDLQRVHDMLDLATPKTLIILNEIFSSTSLQDALYLSKEIIKKIDKLDAFCIWVTFIEELNNTSDKTLSMVSVIDKNDIDKRTYKIIEKQPEGKAYAYSIAKKYHLGYEQILERIK